MQLCGCFTKQLMPIFVPAAAVADLPKRPGHWWISDKWVLGHQISHWAEKLVNMHSVLQDWESYSLPPLDGIAFLKDTLPMTDHEESIYMIATIPFTQPPETLWLPDINKMGGVCFEKITSCSLTAQIATSEADAGKFRESAYRYFNLETSQCPPPRVMILYRNEPLNRRRLILNQDRVEDLLRRYGIRHFEKVTVGSESSSQEQASLFADYGLIISSHSSQLVNTLFAQSSTAVIEVAPAFFNYDFGEMANQMGLKYFISLGGTAQNITLPAEAQECHDDLLTCEGEGPCFGQKLKIQLQKCFISSKPYKEFSTRIKHFDFETDLPILEKVLQKALLHLHESCGGRWKGVE